MSTRRTRKSHAVLTGVMAVACLLPTAELGFAATATTTFTVQITLVNTCTIASATTLNFGASVGTLTASVPGTSTLTVNCTTSAPFNIGLDAGGGSGATVAARKMTFSSNTVTYSLYSDSGHSTVWGNTIGTDTVSSTGTGANQPFTIYGLVPAQSTPPAGTYTDTINVTVTY